MITNDLTTTLVTNKTVMEAFNAILDPRAWWSETIEGSSSAVGDEFTYRHKDLHFSRQKLVEMVTGEKIVWLVTESSLSFVKQRDEWTGTKLVFDISTHENKTTVRFTHLGLVPQLECYEACVGGWNHYLNSSLSGLINSGKGQPDQKEPNAAASTNAVS